MSRPAPRDRPWHRGLDRAAVAAAALLVLDDVGERALTMRRVASTLGVEAASLYVHVDSKDDLVDAVLDRVLDEVVLPAPSDDPRSDLVASFGAYRRALLAHPAAVPLLTRRRSRSASQARLIERSLERLGAAGLPSRDAVDAHVTLIAFTIGFVIQEVGRSSATPAPVATASPVLGRALSTLAERDVDDRFAVGLGLVLDGAGVVSRPGRRSPRRSTRGCP